jgi:hypothetical protein
MFVGIVQIKNLSFLIIMVVIALFAKEYLFLFINFNVLIILGIWLQYHILCFW